MYWKLLQAAALQYLKIAIFSRWTGERKVVTCFTWEKINLPNFRICRKHWPKNTPIKVRGNSRSVLPPSVFNVPKSLLPTPRRPKKQFALQKHFDQREQFKSYESFVPEKKMHKEYNNIIHSRTSKKLTFLFINL